MNIRAALAALLLAAAAASSASCSVGGSASPGVTPPSGSAAPRSLAATAATGAGPAAPVSPPASGAPITVLPPRATTAESPGTSTPGSATASVADSATASTADSTSGFSPPTTAETTARATTRPTFIVPSDAVVVIDPGHSGGNANHPEIINKQVPAGFGQFKACNTTGTATNAGYPEHAFNWQVAVRLREVLQGNGVIVHMTRDSDDGVGPCVNERAAIGNDANAAAVISIHGDGEAAGVNGFFVMTASRPPAGPAVAAATGELATAIRDGMVAGGFPVSSALGENGLWARSDLGGLNLSLRPTVMIECGNMRNAEEAKTMSSATGQQQYAEAIATGVLSYLSLGTDPAAG